MMAFKAQFERISVILPTFNERENARALVADLNSLLAERLYEVIVVDDDSSDGTRTALEALAYPFLRVISRSGKKRGLAASIREGIEAARGNILVIMDSDFNHDPGYVLFMTGNLDFYDAVFASRFLYGGSMGSRWRQILSWLFNIFICLITGGGITDNLYGFYAMRRQVLERCPFDEIFLGYGDYCMRMLYFLQKEGARILQFPAVNGVRRYGVGNKRLARVFWQYLGTALILVSKGRIRHAA